MGELVKQCGAKTRKGTPCRRAPLEGRKRCKLHGGATPRGPESPHFRHGRYSSLGATDLGELVAELGQEEEGGDTYPEITLARALLLRWVRVHDRRVQEVEDWLTELDAIRVRVADLELEGEADIIEELRSLHISTTAPLLPNLDNVIPLLESISRMVKREKDAENANAVSRSELTRLLSSMLEVVQFHTDEPTAERIREDWLRLMVR